jgi:hypothetical protein
MQTALGPRSVPAQAILEQFDKAQQDAADPIKLRAWAPMLAQYGPDLLITCQNAVKLSEDLVSEWLKLYMFRGQPEADAQGKAIARWLSDHGQFRTHARPIARDDLIARGLVIDSLERNQMEQDLILSIHHATAHTFNGTAAVKLIENNLGKAYVRTIQQIQVVQPPTQPIPPPAPPPAPPPDGIAQIGLSFVCSP